MKHVNNELKIYGTGIDIVEKSEVLNLINRKNFEVFKNKWLTAEENEFLTKSANIIEDFATIFTIKEAFIKASCGHVILNDFPFVHVDITNKDFYYVFYKKNDFLKNKFILIETAISSKFVFTTLIIFVNT